MWQTPAAGPKRCSVKEKDESENLAVYFRHLCPLYLGITNDLTFELILLHLKTHRTGHVLDRGSASGARRPFAFQYRKPNPLSFQV